MAKSIPEENKSVSSGSTEEEELEISAELEDLVIEDEELESDEESVAELDISELSEVEVDPIEDQEADASSASGQKTASSSDSEKQGGSEDIQQKIGVMIEKKVNQAVQQALDKAVKDMDAQINTHKRELKSLYQKFSGSTQKLANEISNLQKPSPDKGKGIQESKSDKVKSGTFFSYLVNVLKYPLIFVAGFGSAILVGKYYPQIYLSILNYIEGWIFLG